MRRARFCKTVPAADEFCADICCACSVSDKGEKEDKGVEGGHDNNYQEPGGHVSLLAWM